jgi:hypothetical protein
LQNHSGVFSGVFGQPIATKASFEPQTEQG